MKNFLVNICSSPPLLHVVLWRHSEREREKKRGRYFSSEGLTIFPETRCWKHFITEGCWVEICSFLHQSDSVAIPLRSPEVLWHPVALTQCKVKSTDRKCPVEPTVVSALSQIKGWMQMWIQGRENVNLYQLLIWGVQYTAETWMLEAGSGAKPGQQKWLPTGVSDRRKKESCGNIRVYIFLALIFLTSVCNL